MLTRDQAIKYLFQPGSSRPDMADKPALVQVDGSGERQITFAQLEQLICLAVAKITEMGIAKGDRVVLSSENSPEMVAAIVACWSMGVCAVPVDLRLTGQELGNVLKQLQARALLGSSRIVPNFPQALEPIAGSAKLFDLAKMKPEDGKDAKKIDVTAIDFDAPSFIILTSGTTGIPKGAVHTVGTLITNLLELGEMAGIGNEMRGVLPLPLSHIFGLEVCIIATIFGTTVVFSELNAHSFVQCVAKFKPHIVAGVPTLYGALMQAPKEALDLSNAIVLLSGGAPLPTSLATDFEQKFGKRINNGYGSTESKIVALNQTGPIDCVGEIVPSVKIEIVNEKDEVLPLGETGEIRIAGPILMVGYLGQEETTKKVLHDGHYHTGDMGFFKDGHLYIAGRTKEMIIVAGYKIFPVEVEDALLKHPAVKEVAVLGQPHKKLGQIVKAIVVVNDGELSDKLSSEGEGPKEARQELIGTLKEYCHENLRRELRPMEWDFQPASKPLPKTLAGKIDKKKLETAAVV